MALDHLMCVWEKGYFSYFSGMDYFSVWMEDPPQVKVFVIVAF